MEDDKKYSDSFVGDFVFDTDSLPQESFKVEESAVPEKTQQMNPENAPIQQQSTQQQRVAQTVRPPQQQAQTQQRPQQRPPQQAKPQQRPPQQQARQTNLNDYVSDTPIQNVQTATKPKQQKVKPPKNNGEKKKFPLLLVIGVVVLVIVLAVLVLGKKNGKPDEPIELIPISYNYEASGKFAYDQLWNSLATFDATKLDALIGTEDGDSWLAREWAYVNGVKLREEFIIKVCSSVKFEYPMIEQLSTTGVVMTNELGEPIMISSYMNNGESMKVTVPDYKTLLYTMDEDIEYIKHMYNSSGYDIQDFDYSNELINLMLQWICDKVSIPTKVVEVNLPVGLNLAGQPYIKDDSELDKLLFSNVELRELCKKFSQICMEYDGYIDEIYYVDEEVHNPEYDEWYKRFMYFYEKDNGIFDKRTSMWEPWYLRDENHNIVMDENGNRVVNYYSVKAEDGTDWIEPEETIIQTVAKTRKVESPWIDETGIIYNWIGTYYLENEYKGIGDTSLRVGDGTRERPAGIGTSINTKVKCTDGSYANVRVKVIGYWTGQDAIDYAESFSSKNRGFSVTSVVQLITYEIQIENLELYPIKFYSEISLADDNSNISTRTGTMYGFSEEVELGAKQTVVINDWSTSTELQHKYVVWGKSFGRNFPMVYFNLLAGEGEIPTYSAYEYFTGKSKLK